jgi:hypothetical protein
MMDIEVVEHQVDGLGCGILLGQPADYLSELKPRPMRRGKGEMAPGLELDPAEHIGRATTLVFVIAPGFSRPGVAGEPGRTSARSVTGFSSKQTTGAVAP